MYNICGRFSLQCDDSLENVIEQRKHDSDHNRDDEDSEQFEFSNVIFHNSSPKKSARESGVDSRVDDEEFERDKVEKRKVEEDKDMIENSEKKVDKTV